jgi:hypothetical protein
MEALERWDSGLAAASAMRIASDRSQSMGMNVAPHFSQDVIEIWSDNLPISLAAT